MIRWRFNFGTRYAEDMRIDITDRDYTGSMIEYDIAGKIPVNVTFGEMNADPIRKIVGSSIKVEFVGKTGDFDDLYLKDNDRFRMLFYIEGELESVFIPIPDTMSEPFTPGNFTVEIQGANLSILKQYDAVSFMNRFNRENMQVSGEVFVGGNVSIDEALISVSGEVFVGGSVGFENLANASGEVTVGGNVTTNVT